MSEKWKNIVERIIRVLILALVFSKRIRNQPWTRSMSEPECSYMKFLWCY